jgi:hypothetical protein
VSLSDIIAAETAESWRIPPSAMPARAAPPPPPDPPAVAELMGMGFGREMCRAALGATGGNAEDAIELLLSGASRSERNRTSHVHARTHARTHACYPPA